MPRRRPDNFFEYSEEEQIMRLYALIKHYDLARFKKGFNLFDFLKNYLEKG